MDIVFDDEVEDDVFDFELMEAGLEVEATCFPVDEVDVLDDDLLVGEETPLEAFTEELALRELEDLEVPVDVTVLLVVDVEDLTVVEDAVDLRDVETDDFETLLEDVGLLDEELEDFEEDEASLLVVRLEDFELVDLLLDEVLVELLLADEVVDAHDPTMDGTASVPEPIGTIFVPQFAA